MSRSVLALCYLAVLLLGSALVVVGKTIGSDVVLTIGQAVVGFVVVAGLTSIFRRLKRLFS